MLSAVCTATVCHTNLGVAVASMVEPVRESLLGLHGGGSPAGCKSSGLIHPGSEMTTGSTQRTLESSRSTPLLALGGGKRATTNLGRRLMMDGSEPLNAVTSESSERPLSPLSCALRLRQQRSSSSALGQSMTQTLGDRNLRSGVAFGTRAPEHEKSMKKFGESHLNLGFTLGNDCEAKAAIEERVLQKGDAANPFWGVSETPASVIKGRREQKKLQQMHRAARINSTKRISKARERGEPLPSEIPYDERQEKAVLRRMNMEFETMLQKVTRSRNSYHEVTSVPGGAEALCKSVVMEDYVFC